MTSKLSWQKTHLRDICLLIIQKYNVCCFICHQQFTRDDFPLRQTDLLTEHHLDGDHMNMKLENRDLVHRRCHKSSHMKERRRQ